MGLLDFIIAFIVLIGLWRGYKVGLIRSLIALVSWFIALVAATRLADDVAPQLSGLVQSPVLQMALGFLVVVLVIMVVLQIVGAMASGVIKSMRLGLIDQVAGGILGAAKNILIVLVILSVLAPVLMRLSFWQSSALAPELMPYAPFAQKFASKVLGEAWQQIDAPDK